MTNIKIFLILSYTLITAKLFCTTATGLENNNSNISNAIEKINNDLEKLTEESIIFLGHEGAGKSTLSCLLSGEELIANYLDDTGQVIIKSNNHPSKFNIKEQEFYEEEKDLSLPIRAQIDNSIAIWDMPGFYDNEEQKIFIQYCFNRIITNSTKVKIIIVISDASLQGRANLFFTTLKNLTNIFNINNENDSNLILVISHFPKNRTIEQAKKQIENLKLPPNSTKEINILNALKTSVLVFSKAEYSPDGNNNIESSNIKNDILSHNPSNILLNNSISKNNEIFCQEICQNNINDLNNILKLLIQVLEKPLFYCQSKEDPLSKSISECLENNNFQLSIDNNKDDFSYFYQIKELIALIKDINSNKLLLKNVLITVKNLLNNIGNYIVIYADNNSKELSIIRSNKIQQIIKNINNNNIHIDAFAAFLEDESIPNNLAQEISNKLQSALPLLEKSLSEEIKNLQPNFTKNDIQYFLAAINLLKEYSTVDDDSIKKQALCYQKIGDINKANKDYTDAAINYCDSLIFNQSNINCHCSLGYTLIELEQIVFAIKTFVAILDFVGLKNCEDKIIKHQEKIILADAYFAVGNLNKTIINYQQILSDAKDENRENILKKISCLLTSGAKEIADNFAEKIKQPQQLSVADILNIKNTITKK